MGVRKVKQGSQQPSPSLRKLMADSPTVARFVDRAGNYVEIRTAGDLWKALYEGKTPAVAVSAVSLRPPYGPNILQPKFPKPADQLKWDVLDRALALCDAEGGDRPEAMRKLIARVALAKRVDQREIVNMPLARFVEAARTKAARGAQQDGPFSAADSPTRWAKLYKISAKTFKRRVRDGKIRAKILSDRLYQVRLDDLPKQEKANESGHK